MLMRFLELLFIDVFIGLILLDRIFLIYLIIEIRFRELMLIADYVLTVIVNLFYFISFILL